MDDGECTALAEALADVPDPRKRRGRRHPWGLLLTLISAALASGQRRGPPIGQWVGGHPDELAEQRRVLRRPPPGGGERRGGGAGGGAGRPGRGGPGAGGPGAVGGGGGGGEGGARRPGARAGGAPGRGGAPRRGRPGGDGGGPQGQRDHRRTAPALERRRRH